MSSTNKKSPAARGVPQPSSTSGNKRPNAPPVFRPETATKAAVQPKVANGVVNRKTPVAPPVYRPQPVPKVLQTKRSPSAPPVSRPATRIVQAFRLSSVVQRMEEEKPVDAPKLPPCTYNTIKGENPWHDEKALAEHCFTYCDSKEKKIWVMFAYCVGFPPPELGHGSQLQEVTPKGNKSKGKGGGKQGSAKDEIRWTKFHNCMKLVVAALRLDGKSDFQKAEKFVKQFDGDKPDGW